MNSGSFLYDSYLLLIETIIELFHIACSFSCETKFGELFSIRYYASNVTKKLMRKVKSTFNGEGIIVPFLRPFVFNVGAPHTLAIAGVDQGSHSSKSALRQPCLLRHPIAMGYRSRPGSRCLLCTLVYFGAKGCQGR